MSILDSFITRMVKIQNKAVLGTVIYTVHDGVYRKHVREVQYYCYCISISFPN